MAQKTTRRNRNIESGSSHPRDRAEFARLVKRAGASLQRWKAGTGEGDARPPAILR
jgi:hypothetical protein